MICDGLVPRPTPLVPGRVRYFLTRALSLPTRRPVRRLACRRLGQLPGTAVSQDSFFLAPPGDLGLVERLLDERGDRLRGVALRVLCRVFELECETAEEGDGMSSPQKSRRPIKPVSGVPTLNGTSGCLSSLFTGEVKLAPAGDLDGDVTSMDLCFPAGDEGKDLLEERRGHCPQGCGPIEAVEEV